MLAIAGRAGASLWGLIPGIDDPESIGRITALRKPKSKTRKRERCNYGKPPGWSWPSPAPAISRSP